MRNVSIQKAKEKYYSQNKYNFRDRCLVMEQRMTQDD